MTRALALLSFTLVFACSVDTTAESDSIDFERHTNQEPAARDAKALVNLAYAQSDIESVVELDVFNVFSATPYPRHPGVASCLSLPLPEQVEWLESECPSVTGWGWEIQLNRCQLGRAEQTSGSVFVGYETMRGLEYQATPEELEQALAAAESALKAGTQAVWFDMHLSQANGDPIIVCGVQDGNVEDHATEFSAQVPLRYKNVLYADWQGHGASYLTEDKGKVFVRQGRLHAEFVGEDGFQRDMDVDMDGNLRREHGLYPESGKVKVVGQPAELEYHPFTRLTGEVSVTGKDGVPRTHYLAVE